MALYQFLCPHCSRQFQVENPRAGRALACSMCGGAFAIPADLPPPIDIDAASDPEDEPAASEAEEAFIPFDFREETIGELQSRRRRRRRKNQRPSAYLRQLSPQEKKRRRQRRSLLMMVFGLTVLAIAVVVLSSL